MNARAWRLIAACGAVFVASGWAGVVRAQGVCNGVSKTNNTTLSTVVVASPIPGGRPLFVSAPPGDTGRIFIVEKSGRIFIRKRGTAASALLTFLDISGRVDASGNEMGLLGLAFDPSYASTGYFWVNYTETVTGGAIFTVIARYQVQAGNPDAANAASETRVLRIAQPENNHNGGMLAFSRDGFLYVFAGDGGGAGDQHGTCGNGQNRAVLLGKILRLDVRNVDPSSTMPDCGSTGGVTGYRVPASNPFRDGPGGLCDEIWAYGLRNPWRSSFDSANGDLYVADVGQNCWEEVDWVSGASAGGMNYGWRQMEGEKCFNLSQIFTCTPTGATCSGSPSCNDPSFVDPVTAYAHGGPCSITGGFVYRGCKMPNYLGTYFYGDYCAGVVNSFQMSGGVATNPQDVTSQVDPGGVLTNGLTSFGTDAQGEIYVATEQNGSVLKFVPPFAALEVSGPGAGSTFVLAKTGDWSWEDLFVATDQTVSFYRVYRGAVNGAYVCVFKGTSNVWLGGDPASPSPGQVFAYVVTAVNAAGAETKPGTSGTFNAAPCP